MKIEPTHDRETNVQESRGVSHQTKPSQTGPRQPGSVTVSSAFTLIELMISIALVLLLILGVNQVFTYTTQAVGAGEAINAAIRSSRAAQSTFAGDFSQIVPNGSGPNDAASIIISSRAYYAYRDAKDKAAEGTISPNLPIGTFPADNSAFLDINGDGYFGDRNVNGEVVYPATYNLRNHRLDVLSLFARGQFNRQTGNHLPTETFVDYMTSTEAWIWYGHLLLPDNSLTHFYEPSFPMATDGVGASNQNNRFGSQFVLGRVAMLLKERSPDFSFGGTILDSSGASQRYISRPAYNADNPPTDVQPLSGDSSAILNSSDTTLYYLQNSRFDLASTSILKFRNKLNGYISNASNNGYKSWYDQMLDGNPSPNPSTPVTQLTQQLDRFECNPFVTKPMTAASMAQASPYFLGGCSQFIVEFAGDFLTQDNVSTDSVRGSGTPPHLRYGDVTAYAPDGQLDFYVDSNFNKHIIWYGMPRSTSGNRTISWANGDVVPLRDWLQNAYNSATLIASPINPAPFEQPRPSTTSNQLSLGYRADYSNTSGTPLSMAEANTGYLCAFGPSDPAPKLIRITMTLTDPTGRLPDGVTYQYVFSVPTPGN